LFPTFDQPPEGAAVPTALEVQALAAHGALADVSHRATLMNEIGHLLGIPPGGWNHGQARLWEGKDIRLVWLLRRLAYKSVAERVATNLSRVGDLVPGDLWLAVVTAAREHGADTVTDLSMDRIETWHEGGLDFLFDNRHQLGLPQSITGPPNWTERKPFISHETGNPVHPAIIPARDQLLAYAAQIRLSYNRDFQKQAASALGRNAGASLVQMSRITRLVWRAYAFLLPGGGNYNPRSSVAAQSGRHFGIRTALLFLAHQASRSSSDRVDLNRIIGVPDFNQVEAIRSAKIRVAETLYLERMLTVTRQLLPSSS
jgi:hypothetical protein